MSLSLCPLPPPTPAGGGDQHGDHDTDGDDPENGQQRGTTEVRAVLAFGHPGRRLERRAHPPLGHRTGPHASPGRLLRRTAPGDPGHSFIRGREESGTVTGTAWAAADGSDAMVGASMTAAYRERAGVAGNKADRGGAGVTEARAVADTGRAAVARSMTATDTGRTTAARNRDAADGAGAVADTDGAVSAG
ncbi:hypothetical protein [Streptomyces sp. NPDC001410]|uniref:hypothetical protein n=1 Tax=Streptomyces sp. NPDC001410 TaxID=3364574 RepID=UPI0036BE0D22